MFRPLNALPLLAILAIVPVGCNGNLQKRESPLLYNRGNWEVMHKFYDPMIRNAAAYNMTVADGHFFPHTGRLNSLGATQLNRMSEVLSQFGGTVRYETRSTDDELIAERLHAVKQYIIDTGVDMSNIEITASLSGGRGIWARDAIRAVAKSDAAAEKSAAASSSTTTQSATTNR